MSTMEGWCVLFDLVIDIASFFGGYAYLLYMSYPQNMLSNTCGGEQHLRWRDGVYFPWCHI